MPRSIFAAFLLAACGSNVQTTAPDPSSTGAGASTGLGGSGTGGSGTGGSATSGGGGVGHGGAASCQAALGDYGTCKKLLGWAFDGDHCVQMAGCDCGADCDVFSPDLQGCLAGCSGYCDPNSFLGAGIASDGWGAGSQCDEIYSCVQPEAVADLELILGATLDCAISMTCAGGELRCNLQVAAPIPDSLAADLCTTTLLEGLSAWHCLVIGP